MRKAISLLLCALATTTWLAGCESGPPVGPDAGSGADAGPLLQGSPARGDLVINEVAPVPVAAPGAPAGVDWIELVNRSDAAVDLCGFFVTDDLDRLDHYTPLAGIMPPDPCAPALLDAGAYLLIAADGDVLGTPGHARFKLGEADQVHVVTSDGLAMDGLVYLFPPSARAAAATLARWPDGQGLFAVAAPSPGRENPAPEEFSP